MKGSQKPSKGKYSKYIFGIVKTRGLKKQEGPPGTNWKKGAQARIRNWNPAAKKKQ
jgi:hypothetical protein